MVWNICEMSTVETGFQFGDVNADSHIIGHIQNPSISQLEKSAHTTNTQTVLSDSVEEYGVRLGWECCLTDLQIQRHKT